MAGASVLNFGLYTQKDKFRYCTCVQLFFFSAVNGKTLGFPCSHRLNRSVDKKEDEEESKESEEDKDTALA